MPPVSVTTFCGNNLNASGIETSFVNPGDLPEAVLTFLEQADADSVNSGTYTLGVRDIYLHVRVTDFADRKDLREKMMSRWFKSGKRGPLVGPFDDDGVDYQLDCQVVGFASSPDDQQVYIVHLQSGQTAWRAVDPDILTTWSPVANLETHTITVLGSDETRLCVKLTATSAPSANTYLYQNMVQLINVPGRAFGVKAFCILLDTAALIAAGKIQDDCSDLRLFEKGIELKRWIQFPNTDHTLIWFVVNLAAGQSLTLSGGVSQVETVAAVGTIGTAGNATAIVTAFGMTGSPKTFNVAVAHLDTPAQWAAKVRAALAADIAVRALFTVSGAGDRIVLVRKNPATNDGTLDISLSNGTCTGITTSSSVTTTTGSLYSVASSGDVNTLNFVVSAATQAALAPLSGQFLLRHSTEWFLCKKNATSATTCKVDVVERGSWGTTLDGHQGGDVFSYIQHPLALCYGNDSVGDPTLAAGYDDDKPIFSLADADLTKVAWTASSGFYDSAHPHRVGGWTQIISKNGPNSHLYNIKGDAASGDAALGVKAAAYLKNAAWTYDQVLLGWVFTGAPMRRITCTGRSLRSGVAWPAGAKLECSSDGGHTWTLVFNESTPGSPGSFTDWATHTNVDIDDSSTMLRLVLVGLSDKVKDKYELFEALTFTVYWTSAYIPSLTLLGEQSNYHLDLMLTNAATLDDVTIDDSVELRFPMMLNIPLTLDGEAYTVDYNGANAHSAITLDDESREVWWRALPGTDTITIKKITGVNIGTLDVVPYYYRRRS